MGTTAKPESITAESELTLLGRKFVTALSGMTGIEAIFIGNVEQHCCVWVVIARPDREVEYPIYDAYGELLREAAEYYDLRVVFRGKKSLKEVAPADHLQVFP